MTNCQISSQQLVWSAFFAPVSELQITMNAYILRSTRGIDFKLRTMVPYIKGNRLTPFVNWSNNRHVFCRLEYVYFKERFVKSTLNT